MYYTKTFIPYNFIPPVTQTTIFTSFNMVPSVMLYLPPIIQYISRLKNFFPSRYKLMLQKNSICLFYFTADDAIAFLVVHSYLYEIKIINFCIYIKIVHGAFVIRCLSFVYVSHTYHHQFIRQGKKKKRAQMMCKFSRIFGRFMAW